MVKVETVDEFVARGGEITRCRLYGIRKHSSIPLSYRGNNSGMGKTSKPAAKSAGVDAQQLLNAAAGTKDEAAVILFLKSQGYEVS